MNTYEIGPGMRKHYMIMKKVWITRTMDNWLTSHNLQMDAIPCRQSTSNLALTIHPPYVLIVLKMKNMTWPDSNPIPNPIPNTNIHTNLRLRWYNMIRHYLTLFPSRGDSGERVERAGGRSWGRIHRGKQYNNIILRFIRGAHLNTLIKMLRTELFTLNCVATVLADDGWCLIWP